MPDNQSHQLLLRVPTPHSESLGFCDASPRSMKQWLQGLPRANLGEMARQLYQALIELNQLRTPSENRLQLLELLRPEVQLVCQLLERNFLNQPIVLDERPRKVASLCQALQHHLAVGYKLIVVRLTGPSGRDRQQLLAIALQRAIAGLRGLVMRAYQLYCPVPEGVWLDIHRLYAIGAERNLQRTPIRDGLARHTHAISIEQTYIAALLLGAARCNQIRQDQIAQLADALDAWSPRASLHAPHTGAGLFAVLPQADGPPRYRALIPPGEAASGFGLDTRGLVEALDAHLAAGDRPSAAALDVPEGISEDLVRHVVAAWGSTAERNFQRTSGAGTLTLCLGMTAVHYFLAGERSFDAVIAQPEAVAPAKFSLQGGNPDVWSGAFDAVQRTAHNPLDGTIEFRPSSTTEDATTRAPTFEANIVNQSPGGFCLAWPKEVPAQLQAGELIGLRDPGGWRIAAIRWLRLVRGAGTQVGVELIGPSAQACGIRLVRKQDAGSQYLRGLLLPAISAIGRPASVIVPRLPFQEGHKVLIVREAKEHRAMLGRRLAGTGSYSEFEYRSLDVESDPETSVTGPKTRPTGVEEDFDSLWKSL